MLNIHFVENVISGSESSSTLSNKKRISQLQNIVKASPNIGTHKEIPVLEPEPEIIEFIIPAIFFRVSLSV
jgi:hypothetical protein